MRSAPFVKVNQNLLRLHSLSEAYGTRPSEIIGLETAWGAFQFDEVCLIVGRRVERNLSEGKDAWAGFSSNGAGSRVPKKKYSSVKGLRPIKKVKIKPDGTW